MTNAQWEQIANAMLDAACKALDQAGVPESRRLPNLVAITTTLLSSVIAKAGEDALLVALDTLTTEFYRGGRSEIAGLVIH